MAHAWTVQDFTIKSTDGNAVDVVCNYCEKSVKFTQPDYSNSPEDVQIEPVHSCTAEPKDNAEVTLSEPVVEDASTGDVVPPSAPDPIVEPDVTPDPTEEAQTVATPTE